MRNITDKMVSDVEEILGAGSNSWDIFCPKSIIAAVLDAKQDDFEKWIELTFVAKPRAIGGLRGEMAIGPISHTTVLTHEQVAILICHLAKWLGDAPLEILFPQ